MTEKSHEKEKEKIEWTSHNRLKSTQLGSLLTALKDLISQSQVLDARMEELRAQIFPLIQGEERAIVGEGLRIDWFREKTAEKGAIVETLLAKFLTPDQIEECRGKPSKRKEHMKVTPIDLPKPSESSQEPT